MGLISTVLGLGNTTVNAKTFGSDLLDNAAKKIGLNKVENDKIPDEYAHYNDQNISTKLNDIRGRSTVFRAPINTYNANTKTSTSSFKNTYSMNTGDFCWKEDAYYGKLFLDFRPKVQRMIVKLFQPYLQEFIGQATTTLKNYANLDKLEASGKGLMFLGASWLTNQGGMGSGNIISKGLKNLAIQEYSATPSALYDSNLQDTITNPFVAILRMFVMGHFIHTFEIPYIPNQNQKYINVSGKKFNSSKGGAAGSADSLLNFAKKATTGKEEKSSFASIFRNIPATPTYTETIEDNEDIDTTFYLINKNSLYLVRNYRFLQALAAGAYQVQMPFGILQSPNVYYVEIKGKRLLVWASMSIDALEIGKYRTDEYATAKIYQLSKAKIYENYKDILWPLVWKVHISFKDFTPKTFNAYLHYLKNGSCLETLEKNANNNYLDEMKKKVEAKIALIKKKQQQQQQQQQQKAQKK